MRTWYVTSVAAVRVRRKDTSGERKGGNGRGGNDTSISWENENGGNGTEGNDISTSWENEKAGNEQGGNDISISWKNERGEWQRGELFVTVCSDCFGCYV